MVGCFGVVRYNSNGNVPFWLDAKKWAYCGNMHKGICIRYHFFPSSLEKQLTHHFVFNPVTYKSQFSFERGIVADGVLSKSLYYQEEDEWRIVWYDRDFTKCVYYQKDDACLYVPVSLDNIISVYIGCRCSDEIRG